LNVVGLALLASDFDERSKSDIYANLIRTIRSNERPLFKDDHNIDNKQDSMAIPPRYLAQIYFISTGRLREEVRREYSRLGSNTRFLAAGNVEHDMALEAMTNVLLLTAEYQSEIVTRILDNLAEVVNNLSSTSNQGRIMGIFPRIASRIAKSSGVDAQLLEVIGACLHHASWNGVPAEIQALSSLKAGIAQVLQQREQLTEARQIIINQQLSSLNFILNRSERLSLLSDMQRAAGRHANSASRALFELACGLDPGMVVYALEKLEKGDLRSAVRIAYEAHALEGNPEALQDFRRKLTYMEASPISVLETALLERTAEDRLAFYLDSLTLYFIKLDPAEINEAAVLLEQIGRGNRLPISAAKLRAVIASGYGRVGLGRFLLSLYTVAPTAVLEEILPDLERSPDHLSRLYSRPLLRSLRQQTLTSDDLQVMLQSLRSIESPTSQMKAVSDLLHRTPIRQEYRTALLLAALESVRNIGDEQSVLLSFAQVASLCGEPERTILLQRPPILHQMSHEIIVRSPERRRAVEVQLRSLCSETPLNVLSPLISHPFDGSAHNWPRNMILETPFPTSDSALIEDILTRIRTGVAGISRAALFQLIQEVIIELYDRGNRSIIRETAFAMHDSYRWWP
jgi:hypothetical protein